MADSTSSVVNIGKVLSSLQYNVTCKLNVDMDLQLFGQRQVDIPTGKYYNS